MTASDAVDPKAAQLARRKKYGIITLAELFLFWLIWPSGIVGGVVMFVVLIGALYVTYTFYRRGNAARAHLTSQAKRVRDNLK